MTEPKGQYMNSIDPRDFGAMEAKVDSLEAKVSSLEAKVDQLLALANKSKGGLWAGMLIASALGGVVTFAADHLWRP